MHHDSSSRSDALGDHVGRSGAASGAASDVIQARHGRSRPRARARRTHPSPRRLVRCKELVALRDARIGIPTRTKYEVENPKSVPSNVPKYDALPVYSHSPGAHATEDLSGVRLCSRYCSKTAVKIGTCFDEVHSSDYVNCLIFRLLFPFIIGSFLQRRQTPNDCQRL